MTKIDPKALEQIYADMLELLLTNYELEAQMLVVRIQVSQEQYNELKLNFPDSITRELSVDAVGEKWAVSITRSFVKEDD